MPTTTGGRRCTARRSRSTGCWTSCGGGTRRWRSSPARPAAPGSTWASWRAPTGSGPATRNDALERQTIQRWTQLLLPPELVGSHVGPARAHTTGRTHDLSFRGATALFGHFGIEWDITALDDDERARLTGLVATYRRHRDLLHSGDVVHADHPDPAAVVHGVVATDGSEALFAYVQLATGAAEVPGPARLPGLDPASSYRVERWSTPGGPPFTKQNAAPGWWPAEGGSAPALPGSFLGLVGLPMPVLGPEQAVVLHLTRV